MRFSETLKKLRQDKGVTQEELAKETFISRSTISKFESGTLIPTNDNAERLAEYFGIDIEDLNIDGKDNNTIHKSHKAIKFAQNIVYTIGLTFDAIYISIAFLPIFTKKYIVQSNIFAKTKGSKSTYSIIGESINNSSPFGIILLIICILSILAFTYSRISNKKMHQTIMHILFDTMFAISIPLMVVSIINTITIFTK